MGFQLWPGRAFAAALLLLSTACTTVTVTPQAANPPPPSQTYKNVVLATVDAKDPSYAYVSGFFREGFVRRLRELKAFESVSDSAATPSPPPLTADTLVVAATLTEVDKGDMALRLFIGMGAGRERVAATVTAKASDGGALGGFEVRKAYSGGAGMGGGSFIDIEGLETQLGEQAAQSLLDWTQGKLKATPN